MPMLAIEQARRHFEHLGLTQAAAILDGRLDVAAKKQVPYADFLADLLRYTGLPIKQPQGCPVDQSEREESLHHEATVTR
jgi:hypothetical protein